MVFRSNAREHGRRPFVSMIKYFISIPEIGGKKEIHRTGISFDISECGLGMVTGYPLKAGDILTFEEAIKVNDHSAKTAIVRWAEKLEGEQYRVGLSFII
ncbi:MAG: hypothetical protein FJ243_01745 [Nitrospira sp.]|nr:hypothetical protein [Nitrospira sp.]